MLKRKIKKDLVKSFNELNNYQNDSYLETLKDDVVYSVPSFDKVKYKRKCMLTFGLSFAVLLLIAIFSASFIISESLWGQYKDYDQFILTDDEIDYMEEECINIQQKALYYVNYDGKTFVTLFCGHDDQTNFYYIKLDTTNKAVIVTINDSDVVFSEDGFYYVGCVEKGQPVEKIVFTISEGENNIVYTYYF